MVVLSLTGIKIYRNKVRIQNKKFDPDFLFLNFIKYVGVYSHLSIFT